MFTPEELATIQILAGNRSDEVFAIIREGKSKALAEDTRYAQALDLIMRKAEFMSKCPQR